MYQAQWSNLFSNSAKVYGIYSTSTGTNKIHGNTISNLNNNTSNPAVGTRGFINGIFVKFGTTTITENTLSDISIANANTSAWVPSAVGILLESQNDVQTIEKNTIYNISNTYASFAGLVVGLFIKNSVGASASVVNALSNLGSSHPLQCTLLNY